MKNNAIVTGGASGIGRAISIMLISEGYNVIVIDLLKPDFEATFYQADISDYNQVATIFKDISTLDLLINCAGIYTTGNVEQLMPNDIEKTFKVNVESVFYTCGKALPLLRKSNGNIVNIASGLALVPEANSPAYCASKSALVMLTKCIAIDEADKGVRCNAVLPGPINTTMLNSAFNSNDELENYKLLNPMKRIGLPEDVASVVSFLISDKASYITGGLYSVDGGESLGGIK